MTRDELRLLKNARYHLDEACRNLQELMGRTDAASRQSVLGISPQIAFLNDRLHHIARVQEELLAYGTPADT